MSLTPIVLVTLQASVLCGISNILAQAITAYKHGGPFVIDWVPVFQFFLYTVVNTPPNFLWQQFLEDTFPAYHIAPTNEAIASAAAGDDKSLDQEAKEGRLVEPRLNMRNTLLKTALDQTVGAVINTLLFSTFMHSIKQAMQGAGVHYEPATSLVFLLSGKAVSYSRVDWDVVWAKARAEFWSLITSGWTFWPFVSLINFAFVKTLLGRNLAGSLAGMAWNVYVSMFVATH